MWRYVNSPPDHSVDAETIYWAALVCKFYRSSLLQLQMRLKQSKVVGRKTKTKSWKQTELGDKGVRVRHQEEDSFQIPHKN